MGFVVMEGVKITTIKFTPYDTKKIRLNERILRVDFVTVNLPFDSFGLNR